MNEIDNTNNTGPKNVKKDMSWKSFFFFLSLIIIFRIFVLEPHSVSGSSMDNTFRDGDYVIVDKISYKFKDPSKGDIVVFDPPAAAENLSRFIKRVISTPGDIIEVKNGITYINENQIVEKFVDYPSKKSSIPYSLQNDQYFVMGDNRHVSFDSRYWGPVDKENIKGRVLIRLYPFNKIELFPGIKEYK